MWSTCLVVTSCLEAEDGGSRGAEGVEGVEWSSSPASLIPIFWRESGGGQAGMWIPLSRSHASVLCLCLSCLIYFTLSLHPTPFPIELPLLHGLKQVVNMLRSSYRLAILPHWCICLSLCPYGTFIWGLACFPFSSFLASWIIDLRPFFFLNIGISAIDFPLHAA